MFKPSTSQAQGLEAEKVIQRSIAIREIIIPLFFFQQTFPECLQFQPPFLILGSQKEPIRYLWSIERHTANKQMNTSALTLKIAGRAMRKIRQGSVIECRECRVGLLLGGMVRKTARKWPCGNWKQEKNERWGGLGRRQLKEGQW